MSTQRLEWARAAVEEQLGCDIFNHVLKQYLGVKCLECSAWVDTHFCDCRSLPFFASCPCHNGFANMICPRCFWKYNSWRRTALGGGALRSL